MTTFQAIIYAIFEGIGEFLPISAKAHHILIPYIIGWEEPTSALMGALTLGSFLALLIYFRHDWASMISCFLQVIIYRKRPMTLDERLPLFLIVSTLPVLLIYSHFHEQVTSIEWTIPWIAGITGLVGIPLWFFDSINRRIKGMFDWKWLDAIIVGITQASAILPGWDHFSALLLGAFFLNYKREPATKYAYFAIAPLILAKSITHLREVNFHNPTAAPDLAGYLSVWGSSSPV
jgi:undecaprenyl-diphosphatase